MPRQKLWVALPDTLLIDSAHLREKTVKLGLVARSCAIFKVQKIYLYRDSTDKTGGEAKLLRTMLEYLDTPQYLRRILYPKQPALEYAGLLPPLRTPHHKLAEKPSTIRRGDYREGVVVERSGRIFIDAGLSGLVPLQGKPSVQTGSRVTVKFTSEHPDPQCIVVKRETVDTYWGYEVGESPSLKGLIRSLNADLTILTSRRGYPVNKVWHDLLSTIQTARSLVTVFGSPKHGVYEMLEKEDTRPEDLSKYVLNTFPDQGTATIRTEEALLGTLALLNLGRNLANWT
jgi:predicted SPOUT superfamily RNA methylase MTH1